MKKILYNKKYSGILWAIIFTILFLCCAFGMLPFLKDTPVLWYLYAGIIRFAFGFAILFVIKKLYGRTIKEVLSIKDSKKAFILCAGAVFYMVYYVVFICLAGKSIVGLDLGIFLSGIVLQMISIAFYEELNFRVLLLEGYFYGTKNVKNQIIYAFLNFIIFGAMHFVNNLSVETFLHTGVFGFAFAIVYLKSRNIIVPMILHFIYDFMVGLSSFISSNGTAVAKYLSSIKETMYLIMFVISLVMLLKPEKAEVEDIEESDVLTQGE